MLSEKRLFHLRKSVATFCIALFVTIFSPHILYPATEQSYAREIELYVAEDKVYLLENIRQNITRPSERTVVDALLCESGPEAIELFRKQLKDYPDPVLNKISTARIAAYSQALNGTAPLPKLSLPLPPAKPNLAEKEERVKPERALVVEKPKRDSIPPPLPLSEKPKGERVATVIPLLPPAKPERALVVEKPKRDSIPPPLPLSEKPKRERVATVIPSQKRSIQKNISLKAHLPERSKQEATVTKTIGFTLQFGSFASKENAEALAKKVSLYKPAKAIQQGEFYKVLLKKDYASKEDVAALVKELPFIAIIIPVKETQH